MTFFNLKWIHVPLGPTVFVFDPCMELPLVQEGQVIGCLVLLAAWKVIE